MKRITPEKIEQLEDSQIFVFGSNESGIHGAGAAKMATHFGAEMYKGFGVAGNTFAIPTKDWTIQTLPLSVVELYVNRFIDFAKQYPELTFLVTAIGCGLAGYEVGDIAPLFKEAIKYDNIYLPQSFWNYLTL